MRTEDGYIIYRCLNGEPEAFGLLVDKYKASIYAFIYAKLRNFHDAEDVTQEVFIKAYRNLRTLRRWDSFLAWLYSIASDLCRKWIRSQIRRPDHDFAEDQDTVTLENHSINSYREDAVYESLHEALDSLPEIYQQVLTLRYLGGMNSREIARFLGSSPTAIRQRLSRARAQLKEEMLDMMSKTLKQKRLQVSFTFRVVEAVKQIRIRPVPRITGLPWGISLVTGIIFTVLSLNPNLGLLNPTADAMNSSPSGKTEVIGVEEILVDVLPFFEIPVMSSRHEDGYGQGPGRAGLPYQSALSLAPKGQSEYTFVRSFPEELQGVRGGKLSIDKSGNIYVADSGAKRVQKFDPEGELLMSFGTLGEDDGQFLSLRGMDVDNSGNIYTVDGWGNCIQKFDSNGEFLGKWGTAGSDDGQFASPQDLTTDNIGNIYVADGVNYRVQKFDSEGKFVTKWGSKGDGDGQFAWTEAIAVDSSGNVYVVDSDNHRIQVFDSEGNFLRKWGAKGDGNGQFNRPRDVALDASGNVFVADAPNYRIQKFDSQGNFLKKWGTSGVGEGKFQFPASVAVDSSGNFYVTDGVGIKKFDSEGKFLKDWAEPDDFGQFSEPRGLTIDDSGNLYVADYLNHRIQKFDPDGNFLTTWGTFGTGNGQFQYPRDVAVDSSGNVYTVEQPTVPHTHRVQKFDSDGNFLKSWGGYGRGDGQLGVPRSIAVDSAGNVHVVEWANCRVQVFDSQGNHITKWGSQGDGDGQFRNPEGGIAVDDSGNVYVVDSGNNRIQVFDSKGKFLRKWGTLGNADGEFSWPHGIAVNSKADRIYVADTNNHRIQVFDTKGNFLTKWGTYGDGDMDLIFPQGIAVSRSGEVYVSDTGNHRIKVYRPVGGGVVEPADKKPVKWGYLKRTELLQNYPNPFNPETWIPYQLAEDADVEVSIYSASGELIRSLDIGHKPAGFYAAREEAVHWDGSNDSGEQVASGVYFYAIQAGNFTATKKMAVTR